MRQVSKQKAKRSEPHPKQFHPNVSSRAARVLRVLFAVVLCLFVTVESHAAQALFHPANYATLVKSASSDTITPGIQITLQNWQKYRQFLPFGIQVLYSGQYRWHIASSPDFAANVGPTIDYKWPRRYLMDTERYGGQTQLVKVKSGGYAVAHYVAGLPFAIPAEPNLAYKLAYNARYGPIPTAQSWPFKTYSIDAFLDTRTYEGLYQIYRLSHISGTDVPINPAYGKGYFSSERANFIAPEDRKYMVALTLQPDDPMLLAEQYFYVPELRRSIRYSTGGRCTYQTGIDGSTRDFSNDTANFKVALLAQARIIVLEHPDSDPVVRYRPDIIHLKDSLPGWPKPQLGKWELRDVYIIDYMPLPILGNYCVSHTVTYVDKANWSPLLTEEYDQDGRLWRETINFLMDISDPLQDGEYMLVHHQLILNFKESHITLATVTEPPKIDQDVPAEYRNAANAALPSALNSVNK